MVARRIRLTARQPGNDEVPNRLAVLLDISSRSSCAIPRPPLHGSWVWTGCSHKPAFEFTA